MRLQRILTIDKWRLSTGEEMPSKTSNDLRYILGIQSFANQDSGACIVRFSEDGSVLDYVAISEERLIRKKFPYSFPVHSLGYCMDHYGLDSLEQIDLMVVDNIRVERWFRSGPAYNCSDFDYLKMKFKFPLDRIEVIDHHLAHAASTFYASNFDDAAILIIDGNGSDLQTTSFFDANSEGIVPLDTYRARGIGAVYSAVTKSILGLGTGGEGKTMGLAPFGEKYDRVIEFDAKYDGIRTDYSKFIRRMPYSDILTQLDGANRIYPFKQQYERCDDKDRVIEPYFARVAFDVQEETEKAITHLGKELEKQSKSSRVCLAGGVALNSVANKIMFDATSFEEMFVFPACSDAGIPFGLAIWGYYQSTRFNGIKRRKIKFNNAYTGVDYGQDRIDDAISKYEIEASDTTPEEVAKLISEGNIVAWFQGGSEYGPRALGHRSILADSRREEMKEIVNTRVKHRETYRPFAPAVLLEDVSEFFEIEGESPYMLVVADVKKPQDVPSTTHVDNTARVQTVTQADNGVFYDLIAAFKDITGIGCIMNTSYNDAGEPIVETPEDAMICFLRTDIDYLVLGNKLIKATDQDRSVADKMDADRQKRIEENELAYIGRFFGDYDEDERNHFVEKETLRAVWHVSERSRYELERKVLEWRKAESRVLVIGTPDHTRCLVDHINGLSDLSIVGFVPFEGSLDEPTLPHPEDFQIPFPEKTPACIDEGEFDVILISSHEFQYEISHLLSEKNVSAEVYEVYDNSSRSLILTTKQEPRFPWGLN